MMSQRSRSLDRIVLLVIAQLAGSVPSSSAQYVYGVLTQPPVPTSADSITLIVQVALANPGVVFVDSSLTRMAQEIRITMQLLQRSGVWPAVGVPSRRQFHVGRLTPGLYTVAVRSILQDEGQSGISQQDTTFSFVVQGPTNIDHPIGLDRPPQVTQLFQNAPNPFNRGPRVRVRLPARTRVSLKVWNLLGEEVATLLEADQGPGEVTIWWEALGLPSGVYVCRLQTALGVETKKLVLLK